MEKINQRKSREFEAMKSVRDVFDILKEKFSKSSLYVKYSVERFEVKINEYLPDGTMMVAFDPLFDHDDEFTIYGLSDKYIEIDLLIVDKVATGYVKCKIKSARRATSGRRDLRFKISDGEAYITNFKVSKHSIDVSDFKVPTSIKVILDQYENSNAKLADIVKVSVFGNVRGNGLLNRIKKTGKTLYVENVADPETFKPFTDDFIDVAEVYGDNLLDVMKKNSQKGYKSILIVPIIYLADDDTSIPFAYIQLISKTENFGIDKVLEIKDQTFKLVDRIRNANTINLPVHQHLIDISRGGAKIKVTDNNLKMYLLKSRGMIFDVVFKLQAPITMYGDIKVTYTDDSGELFVGVDFAGNSSRKDELKRFYAVLKPMEAAYKAQLIKSIQAKRAK